MAIDLWGDMDGVTDNVHYFGKGATYWGLPVGEVLARLHVRRDFDSGTPLENPPVWIHRHTQDADIYFVANQADTPAHIDVRFRVSGKDVQIWRPMDGVIAEAGYTQRADVELRTGNREPDLQPALYTAEKGFTIVPLNLAERESVFVIFRNPASTTERNEPLPVDRKLATVSGPWALSFPANWGALASVQMPKLTSWTDSSDPGVKYFSGTATYSKTVQVPASWLHPGRHIWLDLGRVRDIAEVKVNGKPAGLVWAPPYRVDVTSELKPGTNSLEIAVTNEWTNRQLGDRLGPPDKRVLASTGAGPGGGLFGPASQTPPDSGLIGDVSFIAVELPSSQAATH
jgi:alpha-L-rhamnosidase